MPFVLTPVVAIFKIDMMFSQFLSLCKDWLEPISIAIAAFTAIYGINSWRREVKWKRQYELGEEVLVLMYEFHQAIRQMRNPWRHGLETEMKELEVIRSRHEKRSDTFNKLQSLKFRFMVVYDKGSEVYFKQLEDIVNELFRTAHKLDFNYNEKYKQQQWANEKNVLLNKMRDAEAIIWQSAIDDAFDLKIKQTISEFERIWERIIRKF